MLPDIPDWPDWPDIPDWPDVPADWSLPELLDDCELDEPDWLLPELWLLMPELPLCDSPPSLTFVSTKLFALAPCVRQPVNVTSREEFEPLLWLDPYEPDWSVDEPD